MEMLIDYTKYIIWDRINIGCSDIVYKNDQYGRLCFWFLLYYSLTRWSFFWIKIFLVTQA